jgi:hypothetical protein
MSPMKTQLIIVLKYYTFKSNLLYLIDFYLSTGKLSNYKICHPTEKKSRIYMVTNMILI